MWQKIKQQQQQHPFNGPLSETTRVSRYTRKVYTLYKINCS